MWATDPGTVATSIAAAREHVLPTGAMHVVFRLSDAPLRLFDAIDDVGGRVVGNALVGGARSSYYVRDVSTPSSSVGAVLRPGAAAALLGAPAEELAHRHTRLDDLWGSAASDVHARLIDANGAESRMTILEDALERRAATALRVHPAVAFALERFAAAESIEAVVTQAGISHRHFAARFRRDVGLNPKVYCRVLRFQAALQRLASDPSVPLVTVALHAGYSDQAHFQRDFREFAGLTPAGYRGVSPRFPNHVARADAVGRGQILSRREDGNIRT